MYHHIGTTTLQLEDIEELLIAEKEENYGITHYP